MSWKYNHLVKYKNTPQVVCLISRQIENWQYGCVKGQPSFFNSIPAGIRRRYDVEIWLKIGRQRRQRDIYVTLTSFCDRWFNISIQTSKQRRYNVRQFDLKFRRCFNALSVQIWSGNSIKLFVLFVRVYANLCTVKTMNFNLV